LYNGNIIILANETTASAAAMFAVLMQDNALAKVIGSPLKQNPTTASTFTPFILPNTKIRGEISTIYFERPDKDKGAGFIPDIEVVETLESLSLGEDLYINYAKQLF